MKTQVSIEEKGAATVKCLQCGLKQVYRTGHGYHVSPCIRCNYMYCETV